jgi:hypothetical protein
MRADLDVYGVSAALAPVADGAELCDLDLLATALQDAMDAHRQGVILGPAVDELALARAERRARRRDAARVLRTTAGGAA